MQLTRRQFLKLSGAVGAGIYLAGRWPLDGPVAEAFYQSPTGLKKFIQPLRGVGGATGIPVATRDTTNPGWWQPGVTHYTINIGQFTDQLHPTLGSTTLWGYNPASNATPRHLGGIIVANKGTPVQITFRNNLPTTHILPVDGTLMGAGGGGVNNPVNGVSVHLHGGFVPWVSDGGPRATWWPGGADVSWVGNSVLHPGAAANEGEYYYPNTQSARMMWYHDHAFGYTRLNAYAGLASAYIIRDVSEINLKNKGLPDFVENSGREIPIVIQDKIFVGSNIRTADPTWTGPTTPGSLWYPHTYERTRWKIGTGGLPLPDPSVIPEMFGDTMLANGLVYPEVTVEARRYRFRILNACQARFLNLQLYVDNGSADSISLNSRTLTPLNAKGPDFLVLGTEGGFLYDSVTVQSNKPFNAATLSGSLITAPAERWDVVVDFSGFAGKKIILYNDAPAPFPMGAAVNDYFPGAPQNPVQPAPGYGPNTRQILRFNVVAATGQDLAWAVTGTDLRAGLDPFLVPPTTQPLPPPTGVPVRQLTLNEAFDAYGRLIQFLGTKLPVGLAYDAAATETPSAGATEVWQIANLTADTHPVHFHLVNVQILSRQPFDVKKYTGTGTSIYTYTGPARGPDATELGWKETVRMNPGEVTTVIMKFDLPVVPFAVPSSPRTGGNEYVWHCHILEHEEHDMMRPIVVT